MEVVAFSSGISLLSLGVAMCVMRWGRRRPTIKVVQDETPHKVEIVATIEDVRRMSSHHDLVNSQITESRTLQISPVTKSRSGSVNSAERPPSVPSSVPKRMNLSRNELGRSEHSLDISRFQKMVLAAGGGNMEDIKISIPDTSRDLGRGPSETSIQDDKP